MCKIRKVFKETKDPTVPEPPKEVFSFGPDLSDSLSSEGVGLALTKLVNRVEGSTPALT